MGPKQVQNLARQIPSEFFFFFFGCVGSSLLREGFSLVAASGGYSSVWRTGFSLRWVLLLRSTGSRYSGFSSCGAQAQQLWHKGLVTPQHVGSSRARDQTHVPCVGKWILNHCTTREVPTQILTLENNPLWFNTLPLGLTGVATSPS